MVKVEYEVLGKVNIPEANMKDLIWVDRKSGEVRSTPFTHKRLSDEERARRAAAKKAKSEAFRERVRLNALKAESVAKARVRALGK